MTDLVERLRALADEYYQHSPHYHEAADEIERLREVLRIIWIAYQDNDGIRKIFREAKLHD